jgi:hypothetical protein
MSHKFKYTTTTEAIVKLRELGFDHDFSLKEGFVWSGTERFGAEDLQIAYTIRYEGDSDPADESTVYGLETQTGLKGIVVTSDGIYSDKNTAQILQKLHLAKLSSYRQNKD